MDTEIPSERMKKNGPRKKKFAMDQPPAPSAAAINKAVDEQELSHTSPVKQQRRTCPRVNSLDSDFAYLSTPLHIYGGHRSNPPLRQTKSFCADADLVTSAATTTTASTSTPLSTRSTGQRSVRDVPSTPQDLRLKLAKRGLSVRLCNSFDTQDGEVITPQQVLLRQVARAGQSVRNLDSSMTSMTAVCLDDIMQSPPPSQSMKELNNHSYHSATSSIRTAQEQRKNIVMRGLSVRTLSNLSNQSRNKAGEVIPQEPSKILTVSDLRNGHSIHSTSSDSQEEAAVAEIEPRQVLHRDIARTGPNVTSLGLPSIEGSNHLESDSEYEVTSSEDEDSEEVEGGKEAEFDMTIRALTAPSKEINDVDTNKEINSKINSEGNIKPKIDSGDTCGNELDVTLTTQSNVTAADHETNMAEVVDLEDTQNQREDCNVKEKVEEEGFTFEGPETCTSFQDCKLDTAIIDLRKSFNKGTPTLHAEAKHNLVSSFSSILSLEGQDPVAPATMEAQKQKDLSSLARSERNELQGRSSIVRRSSSRKLITQTLQVTERSHSVADPISSVRVDALRKKDISSRLNAGLKSSLDRDLMPRRSSRRKLSTQTSQNTLRSKSSKPSTPKTRHTSPDPTAPHSGTKTVSSGCPLEPIFNSHNASLNASKDSWGKFDVSSQGVVMDRLFPRDAILDKHKVAKDCVEGNTKKRRSFLSRIANSFRRKKRGTEVTESAATNSKKKGLARLIIRLKRKGQTSRDRYCPNCVSEEMFSKNRQNSVNGLPLISELKPPKRSVSLLTVMPKNSPAYDALYASSMPQQSHGKQQHELNETNNLSERQGIKSTHQVDEPSQVVHSVYLPSESDIRQAMASKRRLSFRRSTRSLSASVDTDNGMSCMAVGENALYNPEEPSQREGFAERTSFRRALSGTNLTALVGRGSSNEGEITSKVFERRSMLARLGSGVGLATEDATEIDDHADAELIEKCAAVMIDGTKNCKREMKRSSSFSTFRGLGRSLSQSLFRDLPEGHKPRRSLRALKRLSSRMLHTETDNKENHDETINVGARLSSNLMGDIFSEMEKILPIEKLSSTQSSQVTSCKKCGIPAQISFIQFFPKTKRPESNISWPPPWPVKETLLSSLDRFEADSEVTIPKFWLQSNAAEIENLSLEHVDANKVEEGNSVIKIAPLLGIFDGVPGTAVIRRWKAETFARAREKRRAHE
jgi:hypothetical protein